MTTIQNIQTPAATVDSFVIRKLTLVVGAVAGAALLFLLAGSVDLTHLFTTVVDWSAANYFVLLVVAVVAIAALGTRENALESRKTQFDIR